MAFNFKRRFRRAYGGFDGLFNQRGTAAVELAIVMPLLLFITLAVFSLAGAGQKKALVARAALEGGRLAVVKDGPEVSDYVKRIMKTADPLIDTERVDVKITNVSNLPLIKAVIKPIRITVSYHQPVISGFGWGPRITVKQSYIFEKWDNGVIFDIPAR